MARILADGVAGATLFEDFYFALLLLNLEAVLLLLHFHLLVHRLCFLELLLLDVQLPPHLLVLHGALAQLLLQFLRKLGHRVNLLLKLLIVALLVFHLLLVGFLLLLEVLSQLIVLLADRADLAVQDLHLCAVRGKFLDKLRVRTFHLVVLPLQQFPARQLFIVRVEDRFDVVFHLSELLLQLVVLALDFP